MHINSINDFRKAIRQGAYAWPGGYPVYFITADGEALSFDAAKSCKRDVLEAITSGDTYSGWRVVAADIAWEGEMYCAHTGKQIDTAYGND